MEIRNLMVNGDPSKPENEQREQQRVSINSLVNNDSLNDQKNALPYEIKQRSSISNLTNADDIDMTGNHTQNVTRRANGSGDQQHLERHNASATAKDVIKQQIEKLEQLAKKEDVVVSQEGKPKRYRNKPIWARDYVPQIYKNLAVRSTDGNKNVLGDIQGMNVSRLSVPSISGTMPRNDFTKLVSEWIWANHEAVKNQYGDVPNVSDYIELELKLGQIIDKEKDRRINLPVNTECVISNDYYNQECMFQAGVLLPEYKTAIDTLENFMAESNEVGPATSAQQKNKRGKFVQEKIHVVDMIASTASRNSRPSSTRVTLDVKTKRRVSAIQKQRINDLFIFLPNTRFDLRLTMSIELPVDMNEASYENFKTKINTQREKDRVSYIHQATATRIDLTKVKEENSKVAKYEVEVEMDNSSLIRSIRKVNDDPLLFPDLVQAFLDNARILTRKISSKTMP